jgi:hypothetical protein
MKTAVKMLDTNAQALEEQRMVDELARQEEEKKERKSKQEYLVLYTFTDDAEPASFDFVTGREAAIEYVRGLVEQYSTLSLDESFILAESVKISERITLRQFITFVNKELECPIPLDSEYDESEDFE